MKMDIMMPTTSGVQQVPPGVALVVTVDIPSRRGALVAVNTIVNCSTLHDQMLNITLHRSRLHFTCEIVYTPWAIKKTCHFYFYDNFGKCGPISIILSLLDSQINCGIR